MSQLQPGKHRATGQPVQSASAVQAHAAGEVNWMLDLSKPAGAAAREQVARRGRRSAEFVIVVAAAVWLYDIATFAAHLHP